MKITFKSVYELKTRNLGNVIRYSGKWLLKKEFLSEHITDMNSMALQIIEKCRELNIDIDKKDLIYRIAVHDFDEALYCDLPRDFKYFDTEFRNSVERVVQKLLDKNFSDEIKDDINNSKHLDTFEGCIVKMLDMCQATCTLYREVVDFQNRTLKDVLVSNLKYLEYFRSQIKNLDSLNEDQSRFLISYLSEFLLIKSLIK